MKALKLGLLAVCFLGFGFARLGHAQPGTFVLYACNQFSDSVELSIAHRYGVNDSRFVIKGWFPVGKDDCVQAPGIPKGYFYYFAVSEKQQGRKSWGGQKSFCVASNLGATFYRFLGANYTCKQGEEVLLGFDEQQVVTQDAITLRFK
jgi:uncharacterized membrane protein